jgi:SRSO17 transposase
VWTTKDREVAAAAMVEAGRVGEKLGALMRFATKPELGLALLAECVSAGVSVPWCTADVVHGRDRNLRRYCERQGIGYLLGVPCSFQVTLNPVTMLRVDAALTLVDHRAWQVVSCGPGSKGERRYAWDGLPPPARVTSC